MAPENCHGLGLNAGDGSPRCLAWEHGHIGRGSTLEEPRPYRPKGTGAWLIGPSGILGRTTLIPGLTTGTAYQFAVYAQWPDGTVSRTGVTSVTLVGTLPLHRTARPTSAHPSRGRATTLVTASSTSTKGTVQRTVRCARGGIQPAGDLRYCSYRVLAGGAISVTPSGHGPVRITITLRAVPKPGVTGWRASATWTRTWATG